MVGQNFKPTSSLRSSETAPRVTAELYWYAWPTQAQITKNTLREQFARRSVEHFLPLYQTVRRWKDRRKLLAPSSFPASSYVFVRLSLQDRLQVLQVPGVAKLVGFNVDAYSAAAGRNRVATYEPERWCTGLSRTRS